jgi:glycyl-tRNA synthetase beta chain
MTAKHDLLLEIGCEEIPSRFIAGTMEQLKKEAAALFSASRLDFDSIDTWATPRRLVMRVKALEEEQADLVEKIKGPPYNRAYDDDGQPTKALLGFIQSQGVTLEQVEDEMIKDARYVMVQKETPGRTTKLLLPELLTKLIQKLSFPRPMYWQSKDVRFARPIRWLLALYNNLPVPFSYAGITAGRLTFGHRFLSPGPFEVDSVDHYFRVLEENHIVVDHNLRREMIRRQLIEKAEECGGEALIDDDLLDEVTYLVEYPVAVDGSFDSAYLDLPQEVPITSMQYHQRYFPIVEKGSGRLMPYFVGISNNRFHPNIRKGYAKVLQARLADGRFFFNEDCKEPLENYVEKLKSVIFLESLGSLDQKRSRLVDLVGKISVSLDLPADLVERAERAAHLCKADLVTNMVKEFPELQGVMGREYARLSGEADGVAIGIYEHYLPRYAGDIVPFAMEGALVSLADRIDTLVGCFAIGIQPTGSQDPYALRRQAQGAVTIMLSLDLELSPETYIGHGLDALAATLTLNADQRLQVQTSVYEFLLQRIRFALQDRGIEHGIAEAVLGVPFRSVSEVFKKAAVIEEYLKGPLLDEVIIAYNRVANLAEKADGSIVDKTLFEDLSEKELFRSLKTAEETLSGMNDYTRCLEHLQLLKQPIDNFFDNVMVMVEDDKLRANRLNLLAALKNSFNRLADFSKLQAP